MFMISRRFPRQCEAIMLMASGMIMSAGRLGFFQPESDEIPAFRFRPMGSCRKKGCQPGFDGFHQIQIKLVGQAFVPDQKQGRPRWFCLFGD